MRCLLRRSPLFHIKPLRTIAEINCSHSSIHLSYDGLNLFQPCVGFSQRIIPSGVTPLLALLFSCQNTPDCFATVSGTVP